MNKARQKGGQFSPFSQQKIENYSKTHDLTLNFGVKSEAFAHFCRKHRFFSTFFIKNDGRNKKSVFLQQFNLKK
jgi:hypothetical protein